jgi:hypothetical protein
MKHVKLFEAFSMGSTPAQLLVSGDWTGITKDGTPLDFIHPATYIFEYLPAGSPVPSGYEREAEEPIDDLGSISEEAFGGDQSGVNVAPKDFASMKGDNSQRAQDMKQGVFRMFIDPSIDPSDIKSYLTDEADAISDDPSIEEDSCLSILEDPEGLEGYTPKFISHCKAVTAESKISQGYISKYPQNYSEHPEILPGGNRSGLKIMDPRLTLIFEGM